jgi:ABC-type uncharacterized transport system substrate-binding protein
LVRPIRLRVLSLLATGLLFESSAIRAPVNVAPSSAQNPRIVAWVDFDVEPVRQGLAKLAQHLRAQRFDDSRPVELHLVGADVEEPSQLSVQMARLSATKPALIVASSVDVAKSLLQLKNQIPIYFVLQSDPVRNGLVPSLVSTGSLTGYTFFVPLDVKIMELIRRVFPAYKMIGVLADQIWLEGSLRSQDLFPQARALGLDLKIFDLEDRNEIGGFLADPRARDVQVWYIPYTAMAFKHGTDIAQALAQSQSPTVYARRKFLKLGGLISVQSVDEEAMEGWARSIANILNGVPVGSIPVMRPKEIEIAVNAFGVARLDPGTRERIAREATVFE